MISEESSELRLKARSMMANVGCGRTMGHGDTCTKGYPCNSCWTVEHSAKSFVEIANKLDSLINENESLKKDAARYRWLSKNGELIPEFDGNDWFVIYLDNGAGGFGAGVFDAKFSTFCEAVDFSMSKKR